MSRRVQPGSLARRPAVAAALLVIVLAAAGVRLYPVVTEPETEHYGLGTMGDSFLYHNLGFNLQAGFGYSATVSHLSFGTAVLPMPDFEPAVTRAPLYPLFIAGVYALLGDRDAMTSIDTWHVNWRRLRFVQSLLDALLCLAVFGLVRTLEPNAFAPALLGALMYCFSAYNIYYTREILTETLATLVVTLSLWASCAALRRQARLLYVLTGVGFGLVALCRQEYVLWLAALPLLPLVDRGSTLSVRVQRSLLVALGSLLVVAPWSARNYRVTGEPIVIAAGNLGHNLFTGTFEGRLGWQGWETYPEEVFRSTEERDRIHREYRLMMKHAMAGRLAAREHDRYFRELALEHIRADPIAAVVGWFRNAPRLWYQNNVKLYQRPEASGAWFLFYLAFATIAVATASAADRRLALPVIGLCLYLSAIFFPLHIEPRYAVATMPGIESLAAIGLWKTLRTLRKRIDGLER